MYEQGEISAVLFAASTIEICFFFSPSAAGIKMRLSHKIDKANVERMEKNRQFLYMWNVDFHFIAIVWIGLNTYWYCHLLFSLLSICMHSFRFLCQHTFSRTFERPHQKKLPHTESGWDKFHLLHENSECQWNGWIEITSFPLWKIEYIDPCLKVILCR